MPATGFSRLLHAATVGAALAFAGPAHAIGISFLDTGLSLDTAATAADLTQTVIERAPGFPLTETDTATAPGGGATAQATYTFTNTPGEARIRIDSLLTVDGGQSAEVNVLVQFALTEAVDFTISGGLTGTADRPEEYFQIFHRLTPHCCGPTTNLLFTSANQQTDSFDVALAPPLSGTLGINGYTMIFQTYVNDRWPWGNGSIEATGFLDLVLTPHVEESTVPEPATVLLLAAALAGLGLRRRR